MTSPFGNICFVSLVRSHYVYILIMRYDTQIRDIKISSTLLQTLINFAAFVAVSFVGQIQLFRVQRNLSF